MKDYQEAINELKTIVESHDNIVFFGGAGVSTESGIPDFRSVDGLYHQQYDYPPETILSHTFYRRRPEEFYRFYRNKMLFPDARPNAAHLKLAQLEVCRQVTGTTPVLLLDDVMSELDMTRRTRLLKEISGVQTFVTCTDESDLDGCDDRRSYRVRMTAEGMASICETSSGQPVQARILEDPDFT